MTQQSPVRNTHTVAGRISLTPDAQRLLVAEAMAQVRPEGEVARTGVLGGVEAYVSPTQKAWYDQELARTLRAARKAAQQAPAQAGAGAGAGVEVLAEPVRYEQVEQRQAQRFEDPFLDPEYVRLMETKDAAVSKWRDLNARAQALWTDWQKAYDEAQVAWEEQARAGDAVLAWLDSTNESLRRTAQPEQQQAQALRMSEEDARMEAELEALDALEAAARRPTSNRRPLTEWEQEERWRQDDLMEQRAAFMREDY